MDLASEYAVKELPVLQTLGVRLQLLGRREELPSYVLDPLSHSIAQTQDNTNITVNLALNYGGRRELIDAVQKILADYKKGIIKNPEISEETIQQYLYWPDCPDVDLIIRTSGENRISNFLLWQSANTFFFSTPVLWPDFKGKDLLELMDLYRVQTISQSSTDY
jgi:undecaprenyl diphosphate synthase